MLPPTTAPVMVGRDRELDVLRRLQASTRDGTPRGAVVSGEAGIGKTRLLGELVDSLEPDVVVARGQCVARGDLAPPFAPVRDVLRDLADHVGAEALTEAAGHLAALLPAVLPELADGPVPEIRPEQVSDLVSRLLRELSVKAPLLVVVEDVHWADTSTLDLLRELLHVFRRGRVQVVVTCRDDELGPDDPLRSFLAEASRARAVTTIQLERMDAEAVAEQVRAIRTTRPDDRELAMLARRSDGIPFLVEELVAMSGGPDHVLPHNLHDLLLARYRRLSRPAQDVVRLLSVGGVRVPHELAERVAERTETFEECLREAVVGRVLTVDGIAYAFRHALTQEAVYDEVLPGERLRLHSRYAEALGVLTPEPGRAAEIAHHQLMARRSPAAFTALVAASREARAGAAPVTAAELGERALALWAEVPDARERAGCQLSQLYLDVATAYDDAGDARALRVLDDALRMVHDDDRDGRALLMHEKMVVSYSSVRAGGVDLCRRALELVGRPSDEFGVFVRARVQCGLGIALSFLLDPDGPDLIEQAAATLRALMVTTSDPGLAEHVRLELVRALTNLASVPAGRKDIDQSLAGLAEARVLAGPDPAGRLRVDERRASLLLDAGRYAECCDVAHAGWELAKAIGMERSWGMSMAFVHALADIAIGNLEEAATTLTTVWTFRPGGVDRIFTAAVRIMLLLNQGKTQDAVDLYLASREAIETVRRGDPGDDVVMAGVVGFLALTQDDPATAWAEVSRVWTHAQLPPGLSYPALAVGAGALGALRRQGITPAGVGSSAEAEARLRAVLEEVALWDNSADWRALIDAELAGPDGTGTEVAAWQEAAAAAGRGRVPVYQHAYSLLRLARAQLAVEDRPGAGRSLAAVREVASRAGMLGLLRTADDVARRARLSVAGDSSRESATGGALTAREREVLELVRQGLSNRQIGQRLFISDKTASVHVSAILRKLGAKSRAEAAGRADGVLNRSRETST